MDVARIMRMSYSEVLRFTSELPNVTGYVLDGWFDWEYFFVDQYNNRIEFSRVGIDGRWKARYLDKGIGEYQVWPPVDEQGAISGVSGDVMVPGDFDLWP